MKSSSVFWVKPTYQSDNYCHIGKVFFWVCLAAATWQGCRPTRLVPQGNHLLVKNNITVESVKETSLPVDEMETIIKQKPNRKILNLFRFHLGVYNYASRKKEKTGKIRTWLKETVGEPPVILDSDLTEKSRKQLEQFARNKGYFNATATDTTIYKKKKATVEYRLFPKAPYTIGKITFSISDTALIKPIRTATKGTLMKPGANFDVDMITNERNRMEKSMQNQGYYDFVKEYVYFEADSTIEGNKVNLKLVIKNPVKVIALDNEKDSTVEKRHNVYYINNVFINSHYDPTTITDYTTDTVMYRGCVIANASKLQFKPEVLVKNVFVVPGSKYATDKTAYTYDRLAGLKTFKFINIAYEEAATQNGKKMLDCYVELSPVPKQSFTTEITGTHRGGNLGVATGLSYKNKNSFKGAEILQVRLNAGLEATQVISESADNEIGSTLGAGSEEIANLIPFNTFDVGPEVTLFIPKLFFPEKINKLPKYQNPTTDITFRYSYQVRSEFRRTLTSAALAYAFRTSKFSSWEFAPIDVSLLNIAFTDSVFVRELLSTNNSFLINSYTDHLLIGSHISYIFNNQNVNKPTNFMYFRANLEGMGNSLRALSPSLGLNQDANGNYQLFGVPFAQFLKTDADLRFYRRINRNTNVVYRIYSGVGVPFKNLGALPFEKSFFSGGSNGIRAWQARELGPGGLSDTLVTSGIDQIGDVKLEANAELRFDITKMLEGAIFADVGNTWLLAKDEKRPNGDFQLNKFYSQLAVGSGFGMRFDFNFFILRLDLGLPLKDPGLPAGERWLLQKKSGFNGAALSKEQAKLSSLQQQLSNAQTQENIDDLNKEINKQEKFISDGKFRYRPRLVFNLGIGYPF